jgi:hypothetical protein
MLQPREDKAMIDSINGLVGSAQALQQAKISQQQEISALKLANDMMKQQGQAAVEMIEAVAPPSASEGSGQQLDVTA